MGDDERVGIVKVPLEIIHLLIELNFGQQALSQKLITDTFEQVAKDVAPTIAQRVSVNPGNYLNVHKTTRTEHLVCLSTDEYIRSVTPRVFLKHFRQAIPCWGGRITE
jgi:hypothetical protein